MSKLGNYLRDTAAEMKHVAWPTQSQALVYSVLVVVVCALVAAFLGLFDYIFSSVLNIFI